MLNHLAEALPVAYVPEKTARQHRHAAPGGPHYGLQVMTLFVLALKLNVQGL